MRTSFWILCCCFGVLVLQSSAQELSVPNSCSLCEDNGLVATTCSVPRTVIQNLGELFNSTGEIARVHVAVATTIPPGYVFAPRDLNLSTIRILLCQNQANVLPSSIARLVSLTQLTFRNNSGGDTIPTEIGLLPHLQSLVYRNNTNLTFIPSHIGLLTTLIELDLGENRAEGTIPTQLGLLTRLTKLIMNANRLVSPIPTELGLLTALESLSMQRNRLNGTIPSSFANLLNLGLLTIGQNMLEGSLESYATLWKKFQKMYQFGAADNRLNGTLLPIMEMGYLERLNLTNNSLSGTIPTSIGLLSRARSLSLNANGFTRSIPTQIGMLTILDQLALDRNQLTGPIPEELSRLGNIRRLFLQDNLLKGTIPSSFSKLVNLEMCSLAGTNNLDGNVPSNLINGRVVTDIFHDAFPSTAPVPRPATNAPSRAGDRNDGFYYNSFDETLPQAVVVAFIILTIGLSISLAGVVYFRPRDFQEDQRIPLKTPEQGHAMQMT